MRGNDNKQLIRRVKTIIIDLNNASISIVYYNKEELSVYFDNESRKFYFLFIAFIVAEMHRRGEACYVDIYNPDNADFLHLLDKKVAGNSASSTPEKTLSKIQRTWPGRISNLEKASCFKIKNRPYDTKAKEFIIDDDEGDDWAILFGRHADKRWHYLFAIDHHGLPIDQVEIRFKPLQTF